MSAQDPLSDEAMPLGMHLPTWQECARRAIVILEQKERLSEDRLDRLKMEMQTTRLLKAWTDDTAMHLRDFVHSSIHQTTPWNWDQQDWDSLILFRQRFEVMLGKLKSL
jgi:hypothetical protein